MLEKSYLNVILISTPGFDKRSLKTRIKLVLHKIFKVSFPSKDYLSSSPLQRQIMNRIIKDTKNLNYKQMRGNILIIQGSNDKIVNKTVAKKMSKKLNAPLVMLKSGHFPFLDNAYAIERIVNSYVDSI